ncbi:hypothetical protein BB558_003955, partial [Smittium angustum]
MKFTAKIARMSTVAISMLFVTMLIYSMLSFNTTSKKYNSSTNEGIENEFPINGKAPKQKNLKAALVSLVRNKDLIPLIKTIRQVDDRFNRKYNYPIILLNDEPFTEEFKKKVQSITKANITFGLVEGESWGYPSWIDQEKAKKERETADYMYAKSESYRFMCRFQSGYIFRHPLLKDLDYYWRIEQDTNYFCDIDYDPFRFMKDNNKMYGWTIAFWEFMPTVRTLWDKVDGFMKKYPQHIPETNIIEFVKDDN